MILTISATFPFYHNHMYMRKETFVISFRLSIKECPNCYYNCCAFIRWVLCGFRLFTSLSLLNKNRLDHRTFITRKVNRASKKFVMTLHVARSIFKGWIGMFFIYLSAWQSMIPFYNRKKGNFSKFHNSYHQRLVINPQYYLCECIQLIPRHVVGRVL